jgi:hypothetical protein
MLLVPHSAGTLLVRPEDTASSAARAAERSTSCRGFRWLAIAVALLALLLIAATVLPSDRRTSGEDVWATLHRGHPRLYITEPQLASVKRQIESDSLVRSWYAQLQQEAGRMLRQPPAEHKLVGPRLLSQSRAVLRRVSTLAGLYRLDGDRAKAERARREMLTAANFPDWNPSHFLDVAEMTNALAIGYDWLYDFLSAEDRAMIRQALIDKGLKPGLQVYRKGTWWPHATHNWNQVCNGGLTAGALAIADEEPELAQEILTHARQSIVLAMRSFAPDGGWAEGPGYWAYATHYNAFYLAALESALGTDFGLKEMPGFAQTGDFRVHSVGPLGRTFNYADAAEGAGTAPQMLWLAREFDRPLYARHERDLAERRPEIFHLLWSPGTGKETRDAQLPRDAFFRSIDVAFFRSAWDDRRAVYVGFKGGDNRANHSHLDLGTFVLDALGERWAVDLGGDDYDLPGYFGKQRWTYYRLRTEGHNTLTINGSNQDPTAKAPVVAFLSSPDRAFAVADLTAAYASVARRALRGVALLDRRRVLVQDEVDAVEPAEVVWNFHTAARVESQGATATLTRGTATLEARILSPEGARFEVISANPPRPQRQQPDVSNLVVRLPDKAKKVRIAVLLTPGGGGGAPRLDPLADWIAAGGIGNEGQIPRNSSAP